jgi:hypothetical protein
MSALEAASHRNGSDKEQPMSSIQQDEAEHAHRRRRADAATAGLAPIFASSAMALLRPGARDLTVTAASRECSTSRNSTSQPL